ncbi:hypothetical protein TPHSE_14340 [Terrisporobacter petrolearius]
MIKMHPSLVGTVIMFFIIMVKLMLKITPNDKNMLKDSEIIDVSNK